MSSAGGEGSLDVQIVTSRGSGMGSLHAYLGDNKGSTSLVHGRWEVRGASRKVLGPARRRSMAGEGMSAGGMMGSAIHRNPRLSPSLGCRQLLHGTGWSPAWVCMGGPKGTQLSATLHMTSQRTHEATQPLCFWLMHNRTRLGDWGANQPSG